jgi:hypothetical protein
VRWVRWTDELDLGEASTRERRISSAAVVAVLVLGLGLALTLPQKVDTRLSLEITCSSGAPVVGVWVEAERGGSGFSERPSGGTANTGPYLFNLEFGGAYHVNVGCGGSRQDWKKETSSTRSDQSVRSLACDDTNDHKPGPCRDQR